MKISQLPKTLDVLFKTDITPMIIGHHGVGKSSAIKDYAKANDMECVVVRLGNLVDAGDLLGLSDFVKNEHGESVATKFAPPDWWPRDPDSKGIIFLDEINRIKSPTILQAVFGLAEPRFIGGRRLHTHVLPKGWHVVAASNPPTDDYDVLDIQDQAFIDRFCFLKIDNSSSEHKEYMKSKNFNQGLIAFCAEHEKIMYPAQQEFSLNFIKPSNRSIEFVDLVLAQKPESDILQNILYGLIGVEATVVFNRFMEEKYKLIDPKDITFEYHKVKKQVETMVKENRLDLITLITDNLLDYLSKQESLGDLSSVAAFLKTIPKDISWGFYYNSLSKFDDKTLAKFVEIYE